jgi:hypothetical protein
MTNLSQQDWDEESEDYPTVQTSSEWPFETIGTH